MNDKDFLKLAAAIYLPHTSAQQPAEQRSGEAIAMAESLSKAINQKMVSDAQNDFNSQEKFTPQMGQEYYFCRLRGMSIRPDTAIWKGSPADIARSSLMGVFAERESCFLACRKITKTLI